jgi:4-amino-4-deoxy-L-arabinose transferase-like glycosyltransferase
MSESPPAEIIGTGAAFEERDERHPAMTATQLRDNSVNRPLDAVLLIVFLVLVAGGLRAWMQSVAADTPLIRDELTYLWQAEILATGRLSGPAPALPEFVQIEALQIHDGRRFGRYPIGYPLLLAPFVAAGIPWALNVLLACASLALLHLFVRRIDGRRAAWTAVAITACSPFFLLQSTIFLSHALTLVLSLIVLLALREREARRADPRWAAAAGAAVGYAFNVSPFVAAALSILVVDRVVARRALRPPSRGEGIGFVAAGACGAILFAGVNVATTGSPWTAAYLLDDSVRPGFGPSVGPSGYTPSDAWNNATDRLASLDRTLFAWPWPSLLLGAWYVGVAGIRRWVRGAREEPPGADRWDRPLAMLFVAVFVIYLFWYHSGTQEETGPRFLYPAMPALVVFTARGISDVAGRLASMRARFGLRVPAVAAWHALAAGAIVLSCAAGAARFLEQQPDAQKPRERRAVRALLEDLDGRGIERGTVFVRSHSEAHGPALLYVSRFDENAPLLFARDLGRLKNRALLRIRADEPIWTATFDDAAVAWRLEAVAREALDAGR